MSTNIPPNFAIIHTALFAEAKPIIEHFKLQCLQTKPYWIYTKGDIVFIVIGMKKEKTTIHVKNIFESYYITKAINIGIAGCKDGAIKIGSLFCTSHELDFIDHESISTVNDHLTIKIN